MMQRPAAIASPRIVKGDPSDQSATSPLTGPGLNVAEGGAVLADQWAASKP